MGTDECNVVRLQGRIPEVPRQRAVDVGSSAHGHTSLYGLAICRTSHAGDVLATGRGDSLYRGSAILTLDCRTLSIVDALRFVAPDCTPVSVFFQGPCRVRSKGQGFTRPPRVAARTAAASGRSRRRGDRSRSVPGHESRVGGCRPGKSRIHRQALRAGKN
ncbi:hypothetical protein D3C80_1621080 [compost metagenome]